MIEITAGRRILIVAPISVLSWRGFRGFLWELPLIKLIGTSVSALIGILVLLISRFSLFNPLFMFCLLQLTLFSLNWLPFLFEPTLINDTYGIVGLTSKVERAIISLNLLTFLWLVFAFIGHSLWRFNVNWRAADANFRYVALALIAASILSFSS